MLCLWALQMSFGWSVGGPWAALMGGIALHLDIPSQNRMQVSSDQRGQLLTGAFADLVISNASYQLGSRRAQERSEQRRLLIPRLFAILSLQTVKKYTSETLKIQTIPFISFLTNCFLSFLHEDIDGSDRLQC